MTDKSLDFVLTEKLLDAALKDAVDACIRMHPVIAYHAERGANPMVVAMAVGIVLGIKQAGGKKNLVLPVGMN